MYMQAPLASRESCLLWHELGAEMVAKTLSQHGSSVSLSLLLHGTADSAWHGTRWSSSWLYVVMALLAGGAVGRYSRAGDDS